MNSLKSPKAKRKKKTGTRVKPLSQPTAARAETTPAPRQPPPDDVRILRRELEVHREELAVQNEDLRRANSALLVANERYARLYNDAPIAYFTLGEDSTIVEVNLAGAELLEASRNFLFGRRFDDLVAPSSRASFRQFCRRVLEHGGRPTHETVLTTSTRRFPARIEAARLDPDVPPPSIKMSSTSSAAAASTSWSPSCVLAISDDTHRREEEDERRRLERRVAEAQRIESLGLLANGVAHEMNNMLAAALAHAELVLMEEGASERVRESGREIQEAVLRATRLAQQMLAYSGQARALGTVVTKTIDVSEMIRSMRSLLGEAASSTITIDDDDDDEAGRQQKEQEASQRLNFDLALNLPLVAAESAQLQQAVLNVVMNAAEATRASGRILVRTGFEPEGEDRGKVTIEVIDTGEGMDEQTRLRAFDPFFTTKFTGRGLGLAVVHGSIRAHGGIVTIQSRRHRGTTVKIALPPAQAPSSTSSPAANDLVPQLATITSSKKGLTAENGVILVVDDNEQLRKAIGRGLRENGFSVAYAGDGIEALEEAARLQSSLSLVLLDLHMPRLDGAAALLKLKARDPTLPVVLMSGFVGGLMEDAVRKLADAFLPKPFVITAVLEIFNRIGRRIPCVRQN